MSECVEAYRLETYERKQSGRCSRCSRSGEYVRIVQKLTRCSVSFSMAAFCGEHLPPAGREKFPEVS